MFYRIIRLLGLAVGILVLTMLAVPPTATDRYSGGSSDYCVNCHPTFQGRGDLHDLHVGNGQFTQECSLCHVNTGDNPITSYSEGTGQANSNLGCMGCHGHNYGENHIVDYGLGLLNTPKPSGYGLRLQHFNKGVTGCDFCHGLPSQGLTPFAENVNPPYYALSVVNITDSCNSDGTEDNSPEAFRCQGNILIPCLGLDDDISCGANGPCISREDNVGLDNDGDTFIDAADSDCVSETPGESGGPAIDPLRVTAQNTAGGTLDLSIGVACSATDQTLVYGPLAMVSSYEYDGQDCSIDASGTHTWSYGGGSGSLFFLVVPNNGTVEGSYGTTDGVTERPEDTVNMTCPLPQDLVARCD